MLRTIGMFSALAAAMAPGPVLSQTQQDTITLYSAILASGLGEEPVGPGGTVEVVCAIASSEGFRLATPDDPEAVPDTLPDLTPRLREMVGDVLASEYGLPLVEDCERFTDGQGRQGIRVGVSAPEFVGDAEATVYLGISMGGLWGSGARCTWRKDPKLEAWTRVGCTGTWISDDSPEFPHSPPPRSVSDQAPRGRLPETHSDQQEASGSAPDGAPSQMAPARLDGSGGQAAVRPDLES